MKDFKLLFAVSMFVSLCCFVSSCNKIEEKTITTDYSEKITEETTTSVCVSETTIETSILVTETTKVPQETIETTSVETTLATTENSSTTSQARRRVSATPTPKPTRVPTSTPTPRVTKVPTSTPTPRVTRVPSNTPTPTVETVATTTVPRATSTPTPTNVPTATPTPKPATPTPTPVPHYSTGKEAWDAGIRPGNAKEYTVDLGNGKKAYVYGYYDRSMASDLLNRLVNHRNSGLTYDDGTPIPVLNSTGKNQDKADVYAKDIWYSDNVLHRRSHTRPNGGDVPGVLVSAKSAKEEYNMILSSDAHYAEIIAAKNLTVSTFCGYIWNEGSQTWSTGGTKYVTSVIGGR